MAALTGNKIKDSYLGLLKTTNSGILTSNFVRITDGGGNNTQLYLSNAAIRFYDAYTFPSADGTVGQVLTTDANGALSWADSSDNQTLEEVLTSGNTATLAILSTADGNTFGSTTFDDEVTGTTANFTTSVTSPDFIGDLNGSVRFVAKMIGSSVLKGQVVYISGLSGNTPEVQLAKADSTTTMTAVGMAADDANQNNSFEVDTLGSARGIDLSDCIETGITLTEGDVLYVSATEAGHLTNVAPTGVANLIQNIGMAIRVNPTTNATIKVMGAGRANASPNLPTGILLGDTTNVSTAITDGSSGQILSTNGSGSYSFIDNDEGTVTSIALSVPTGLTVTNSPITTSGTITIGGTLGVANGGTGATTLTGILLGNGTSAISSVTDGTVGQVLSTNANGTYSFIDAAGGDVTKTGTITANQIAVWNDSTDELRSDETVTIGTDHSITLLQKNSLDDDKGTHNIGGGNIDDVTGQNNVGFGIDNLGYLVSGQDNNAFGNNSQISNSSGSYNTSFGNQTLNYHSSSDYNVAIGYQSLRGDNIGGTPSSDNNTAIGTFSLRLVDGGNSNTAIGYNSGSAITTGSNNVIIGSNTGSTIATSSNNIIISDGGGNSRIQVDGGGVVGIGVTPSPQSGGALAGSVETNGILRVRGANGSYFTSGDGLELSKTSIYSYNRDTPSGYNTLSINDTITVEGAGNVGIGTSGTPSAKLDIVSPSAASSPYISKAIQFAPSNHPTRTWSLNYDDGGSVGNGFNISSYGTKILYLNANGRVGIGTASPAYLLTASAGNLPYIASVTVDVQTVLASDQNNGRAYIGTRTDHPIAFVVNGNEKMRISSGGNVLIGSGTPSTALHLKQPSNNRAGGIYSEISGGGYGLSMFVNSGGYGVIGSNGSLTTDVLTLDLSAGNVGIGATSPTVSQSGYGMEIGNNFQNAGIRFNVGTSGWGYTEYYHGSTAKFIMGYRNTDDSFRIRTGASLVSGNGLTISSGGNVGIGTSSPEKRLHIFDSTQTNQTLRFGNPSFVPFGEINYNSSGEEFLYIRAKGTTSGYGNIVFETGGTPSEAMRITSGGFTKAKANGGVYFNGAYHEFANNNNVSGDRCVVIGNKGGSNTNNTSSSAFTVADTAADRLVIYGNGDVQNVNNAYGQLSDLKLKENISDGTPKLNDLLKVKIKNFNFIGSDIKQIGVIAQELEEIFPSMISESPDTEDREVTDEEGNVTTEKVDLGTVTKSVKYSVFTPMLIKAIQEQQTIIEDLKARIETLEG